MKAIKDLLQRIRTDRKNRQGTWIGVDESHIILNALEKSERLEAENAELRERLDKAIEFTAAEARLKELQGGERRVVNITLIFQSIRSANQNVK